MDLVNHRRTLELCAENSQKKSKIKFVFLQTKCEGRDNYCRKNGGKCYL